MDNIERAQRESVVKEALSWLGTPFRDQAMVKGAGVDCALLAVAAFCNTGVLEPFDPRPYPPRWHLHKDEERFLGWITKFGAETDQIKPANVILYREGRCFSHCGIVTLDGNLIHASWRRREVMVSPLFQSDLVSLPSGKPRPRKIFDIWARKP